MLVAALSDQCGGLESPPSSRLQGCSNPSSYLPSLSFEMVFLPSSPSDCTLQPRSRGRRQSEHGSSNAELPDHPGRATRLFRPFFPGTRLRRTKGKRSSRTSLSLRASWLSSLLFFLLSLLLPALIDFLLIKATTTFCNSPRAIPNTRAPASDAPMWHQWQLWCGRRGCSPTFISGRDAGVTASSTSFMVSLCCCSRAENLALAPSLPRRGLHQCAVYCFCQIIHADVNEC